MVHSRTLLLYHSKRKFSNDLGAVAHRCRYLKHVVLLAQCPDVSIEPLLLLLFLSKILFNQDYAIEDSASLDCQLELRKDVRVTAEEEGFHHLCCPLPHSLSSIAHAFNSCNASKLASYIRNLAADSRFRSRSEEVESMLPRYQRLMSTLVQVSAQFRSDAASVPFDGDMFLELARVWLH